LAIVKAAGMRQTAAMHLRILPLALVLLLLPGFAEEDRTRDAKGREPEQVLLEYLQACKEGKLVEAAERVWWPKDVVAAEQGDRFKVVERRIKSQAWDVRVVAKAVDKPYAAVVFTKYPDKREPQPILLVLVEGEWKLHQKELSGRMSKLVPEADFARVGGLIRWGNDKCLEINRALDAEAKVPPGK